MCDAYPFSLLLLRCASQDGRTPMHIACAEGSLDVVKWFATEGKVPLEAKSQVPFVLILLVALLWLG